MCTLWEMVFSVLLSKITTPTSLAIGQVYHTGVDRLRVSNLPFLSLLDLTRGRKLIPGSNVKKLISNLNLTSFGICQNNLATSFILDNNFCSIANLLHYVLCSRQRESIVDFKSPGNKSFKNHSEYNEAVSPQAEQL